MAFRQIAYSKQRLDDSLRENEMFLRQIETDIKFLYDVRMSSLED